MHCFRSAIADRSRFSQALVRRPANPACATSARLADLGRERHGTRTAVHGCRQHCRGSIAACRLTQETRRYLDTCPCSRTLRRRRGELNQLGRFRDYCGFRSDVDAEALPTPRPWVRPHASNQRFRGHTSSLLSRRAELSVRFPRVLDLLKARAITGDRLRAGRVIDLVRTTPASSACSSSARTCARVLPVAAFPPATALASAWIATVGAVFAETRSTFEAPEE
jgi:hypothetical protein